MSSADQAVLVEGVDKVFRLYREGAGSVRGLVSGFHRTRYREFYALQNIDLEIPRGSITGIIGPNGSGKSTLLRVMAGIYRPSRGRLVTNGRVSALLELGAGFHHELSGLENIKLNAAIMGLPRGQIDKVLDDIVDMAAIGDFIESPVEVYSSGMRARLGFAVSVHLEPEILLVDETIAVGDLQFYEQCLENLDRLIAQGVTVVLVSHDLSLIERKAEQVLWLEAGQRMAFGAPAQVMPDYIDHYIGGGEVRNPEEEDGDVRLSFSVESRSGTGCVYVGEPLSIQASYSAVPGCVQVHAEFVTHHGELPICAVSRVSQEQVAIGGELTLELASVPLPPGQYALRLSMRDDDDRILATSQTRLLVYPSGEESSGTDLLVQMEVVDTCRSNG